MGFNAIYLLNKSKLASFNPVCLKILQLNSWIF